jgi:hypothetical protein
MGMSGQLHALAALPLRKQQWVSIELQANPRTYLQVLNKENNGSSVAALTRNKLETWT